MKMKMMMMMMRMRMMRMIGADVKLGRINLYLQVHPPNEGCSPKPDV